MRLKNIGKFQEGGAMPPQDPAAAQGGGDPMQEILMGCQQAVDTQDCQIALQVCQIMLEMAGGGAAPAEAAPAPAPAEAPENDLLWVLLRPNLFHPGPVFEDSNNLADAFQLLSTALIQGRADLFAEPHGFVIFRSIHFSCQKIICRYV